MNNQQSKKITKTCKKLKKAANRCGISLVRGKKLQKRQKVTAKKYAVSANCLRWPQEGANMTRKRCRLQDFLPSFYMQ